MALQDGFKDPTHNVIYNRLGITDQDELRRVEGEVSLPAMLRVVTGLVEIPGQFNAAHVKQIHREVFKDVYDWAGQTRANGPDGPFQGQKQATFRKKSGDTMRYGPFEQLEQRLDAIGAQLNQENNLRGLNPEQFAQRAAYYFDQYNHTHAFREGNGRTGQALMAVLGRQAGYQVELPKQMVEKLNDVRDMAIIRPFGPEQPERNLQALAVLLGASTQKVPGPEAEALRDPSQARPLSAPTPEMQRMEAQRVMQSSSFEIGSAIASIDLNTRRGNQIVEGMNQALLGETSISKVAPLLLAAAQEVSKHPILSKEKGDVDNARWLTNSVQQLVKLEQPAQKQAQAQAQKPDAPKPEKPAVPKQQPPKRKGPKL